MMFFDVEEDGDHDEVYGAFCEEGGELRRVSWVRWVVEY